jgi:hypothetical protein
VYEYLPYEDKERQNQSIAQQIEGALKEKSECMSARTENVKCTVPCARFCASTTGAFPWNVFLVIPFSFAICTSTFGKFCKQSIK